MAPPRLSDAGSAAVAGAPAPADAVSNDALVALNRQLRQALDEQRSLADDLQNVLFSTDVATLFLDRRLHVRLFTPAMAQLFAVDDADIGRPLAAIASLAVDTALSADARVVIKTLQPIDREIEARSGAWHMRRITPYRARGDGIEGVVITFIDITERRQISEALEIAKRDAQIANIAKSRFLAAASHDLRQPLQTLTLLHGLLAKTVTTDAAVRLVVRLDETLGAMSGMLNALLDINRIEAGNVRAEKIDLDIGDLLDRMKAEFDYIARAKGIDLRVVPSRMRVHSDPALLDQIVRNLVSNALKYTRHGKVLIGCRRVRAHVRLEIWDTGIGIPQVELEAIFEEYHQLDNAARERSRGLGLGLSIVKRLGALLRHPISVRSVAGRGSMFAVTLDLPPDHDRLPAAAVASPTATAAAGSTGTILVVDDDPEILDLLDLVLTDAGHRVVSATDGAAAIERVARERLRFDLVLVDYNLPGTLDGLQLIARLRARTGQAVPAIVLTGDISTRTLRDITAQQCTQLSKPVKPAALLHSIEMLLSATVVTGGDAAIDAPGDRAACVYVVEDDAGVRDALCDLLDAHGFGARGFGSGEAFLAAYVPGGRACLLVDAGLPGMGGIELLQLLAARADVLPSVMITGRGDIATAVAAMKAGARDFIEKPVIPGALCASISAALGAEPGTVGTHTQHDAAVALLARLTARQRQIMALVLAGHPNKNIAADLGISQRTVETHRAAIMARTGSASLPDLVRLALV